MSRDSSTKSRPLSAISKATSTLLVSRKSQLLQENSEVTFRTAQVLNRKPNRMLRLSLTCSTKKVAGKLPLKLERTSLSTESMSIKTSQELSLTTATATGRALEPTLERSSRMLLRDPTASMATALSQLVLNSDKLAE